MLVRGPTRLARRRSSRTTSRNGSRPLVAPAGAVKDAVLTETSPLARARHVAVDRALVAHRIIPALRLLFRLGYFAFEVEGLEHVPRTGPAVYVANHAGWFALDAFILAYAVALRVGAERTPHFAVHDSLLALPSVGSFFRRLGGIPASSLRRPERLPKEIDGWAIFPEGVQGNCKPFWHAYQMREWSRGFVRLAIARQAPIVPVAVLGGEECLPVAWTVRRLEPIIGSIIGWPLAPFPLPTRWKVVFHEPVRVPPSKGKRALSANESEGVARRLREGVQRTLDRDSGSYLLGRLSSTLRDLGVLPVTVGSFGAGERPPFSTAWTSWKRTIETGRLPGDRRRSAPAPLEGPLPEGRTRP